MVFSSLAVGKEFAVAGRVISLLSLVALIKSISPRYSCNFATLTIHWKTDVALGQEIAPQAVDDLGRTNAIVLLLHAAIARNIKGCATFTFSVWETGGHKSIP